MGIDFDMCKIYVYICVATCYQVSMSALTAEIRDCLRITGKPQKALALAAEIPAATICNLLSGKRSGVHTKTHDAIRRGISKLLVEHRSWAMEGLEEIKKYNL